MKALIKPFLITAATVTLLVLAYKGVCGNSLMGGNKCKPGTKKVPTPISDEAKITLMGIISNLEAKLSGLIATHEPKFSLQRQLQEAKAKLAGQ